MEERPNYYAIIPANVRYSDITPNAKLLYGEITCLCNKEGYCYATNDFIETEIIYKEGSKEILNRYIRIVKDPIKEKFNTPIKEKFKDNNTSINNTRYNIKENIKEKTKIDLSFIENENYKNLVKDWLDYKKQKKSNYTQKGIEFFYKRLLNLSNSNIDIARQIIENSVANNYSGIFELKKNNYTKNNSINYCSEKNCPY